MNIDKSIGIVKEALRHSSAQALLIFGGILVVVSMWVAKEYVFVSFLTLFYVLINFKMEAFRRHESLGRYAVGSDHLQNILFTITSVFHFMWWVTAVVATLSTSCEFAKVTVEYFFLGASAMTMIWLWRMFNNKQTVEKNFGDVYEAYSSCKNCGLEDKVKIPQKRPLGDQPCPRCGLYELKLGP